jgi:tetratricopeptide (TPR) repeat protein
VGEGSTSTEGKAGVKVLCQWCGAANPEGSEVCGRCGSPLLVLSGLQKPEEQPPEEDQELAKLEELASAFQEDVLERLTLQEKQIAALSGKVEELAARVAELEGSLSIVDAGLRALAQLLARRKILREAEFQACWEREAESEAARAEVVEDLAAQREVILARAKTLGEQAERAFARALDAAELHLAAGNVGQAVAKLLRVLKRFPRHPEMAKLVGDLAFQQGQLQAARQAYSILVELQPNHVDGLVSLATLLADEGEIAEAEKLLQRAARVARDSFLPPFALGALKLAQEDLPAARRFLRQALAKQESPVAAFLAGLVELRLGRPGTAVKLLERAVALEPEMEEAIYTLGLAYLERGFARKALQCFRRVLELDPQRLRYQEAVRFLLAGGRKETLPEGVSRALAAAAAAAERGEAEHAWETLRAAAEAEAHPSLLAAAALVASASGKAREAVSLAHRVLKAGASGTARVAAWTALFETLRATGRSRALVALASKLRQQGQSELERGLACYELALTLAEEGRELAVAEELAHEALALFPSELRPYAQAAVGRVYLAQERYQDALDYLEPAAAAAPSPQILTQLGLGLLGVGEKQEAAQVLRRARAEGGADLQADVLDHLLEVAWLAARRKS